MRRRRAGLVERIDERFRGGLLLRGEPLAAEQAKGEARVPVGQGLAEEQDVRGLQLPDELLRPPRLGLQAAEHLEVVLLGDIEARAAVRVIDAAKEMKEEGARRGGGFPAGG